LQWKNHVLERMFGYGHGELLGQAIRVLYADGSDSGAQGRRYR
jgi:hypothetical protein